MIILKILFIIQVRRYRIKKQPQISAPENKAKLFQRIYLLLHFSHFLLILLALLDFFGIFRVILFKESINFLLKLTFFVNKFLQLDGTGIRSILNVFF